jgi:hypothetical protein
LKETNEVAGDTEDKEMSSLNEEHVEVLIRIDERTRKIAENVDKLSHAIYGNGSPGLTTKVAILESTAITKSQSKIAMVGIYAALIAGGVSLLEMIVRRWGSGS